MCVCACARVCAGVCMRACMRACVHACVCFACTCLRGYAGGHDCVSVSMSMSMSVSEFVSASAFLFIWPNTVCVRGCACNDDHRHVCCSAASSVYFNTRPNVCMCLRVRDLSL